MQADPIGIKQCENHLYGYVGNNPVNITDPLGLHSDGECFDDCMTYVKRKLNKCLDKGDVLVTACKAGCWPLCLYRASRGIPLTACLEACWEKCELVNLGCWVEYWAGKLGCWTACKNHHPNC